jgi:hypothetical protein
MTIPGHSYKFEEELGVDKSKRMDSYDYMVIKPQATSMIPDRYLLHTPLYC